jgi:putative membrane protein
MYERSIALALATALAVASASACNDSGSKPPETPADTTTTTGASTAAPHAGALPEETSQGRSPGQTSRSARAPLDDGVPTTHAVPIAPEATPGLTTSGATPTTTPTSEPIDDAQIVEVLQTRDAIALEQGREGARKARSDRVRQFAEGLVRDARTIDEKLAAIERKSAISPRSSRASNELRVRNDAITASLKSSDRSDLDRVFVDAQVSEQAKMLDLIDDALIPAARDDGLRKLLESMRTKVAVHLSDAEVLQATPGKTQ